MTTTAVIVFARAPIAGHTKTRLIPALGSEGAATLHARLLAHALQQVARVPNITRYVFVDNDVAVDYFDTHLASDEWTIKIQCGADLGERMANALGAALAVHTAAIVIGSDIVDLDAVDIAAAVERLAVGDSVVIGASADGGYWLIGLRELAPKLFHDIEWGTSTVYAATTARLNAAATRWFALAIRHDIDRPEDLVRHAHAIARLPEAFAYKITAR